MTTGSSGILSLRSANMRLMSTHKIGVGDAQLILQRRKSQTWMRLGRKMIGEGMKRGENVHGEHVIRRDLVVSGGGGSYSISINHGCSSG